MSRATDTKTRRIAATEARVHFGELVDEVADGRNIAEVKRADGYTVVVEPAGESGAKDTEFDADAWLANLKRIHERIRAYREENPEAAIMESSEDIIRELRDSR